MGLRQQRANCRKQPSPRDINLNNHVVVMSCQAAIIPHSSHSMVVAKTSNVFACKFTEMQITVKQHH